MIEKVKRDCEFPLYFISLFYTDKNSISSLQLSFYSVQLATKEDFCTYLPNKKTTLIINTIAKQPINTKIHENSKWKKETCYLMIYKAPLHFYLTYLGHVSLETHYVKQAENGILFGQHISISVRCKPCCIVTLYF